MKIFYWTPYIGNVGTIKATINSAKIMKESGYDVYLYKLKYEWIGYEDIIEEAGIKIIDLNLFKSLKWYPHGRIPSRIYFWLLSKMAKKKLINSLNTENPDVLMIYLLGFLPLKIKNKLNNAPKMIASIQGKPTLNWFRKRLWKKYYCNADKIITLSKETMKEVEEKIGFKDKMILLNNPIVGPDIDEKLNACEPRKTEKYILGVGRLTEQKNFKLLIESYNNSKAKETYKLYIAGEGEQRKNLEEQIKNLKLENRVTLLGFVKNPYIYMKNADLFVLSSLWEDAGHVLVEAAYCKCFILSTRCPNGQEEFLDYGEGGILCENGDVEDMSKCIDLACIEMKQEDKNRMIEKSFEKSMKFSWENHKKNLDKLLIELK